MAADVKISIHTSLTGSDYAYSVWSICYIRFQSTLPSREVTAALKLTMQDIRISIHTSLTGSDHAGNGYFCMGRDFNPHFPHGK